MQIKIRRTIELEESVDYLIRAFRAKMLLETGTDQSYNETICFLVLWGVSKAMDLDDKWIIERVKAGDWEEELKKYLRKKELPEALEYFIEKISVE